MSAASNGAHFVFKHKARIRLVALQPNSGFSILTATGGARKSNFMLAGASGLF
jgi:hypothetical protein